MTDNDPPHQFPRVDKAAQLPMLVLPVMTVRMGSAIHKRFDAVQEHFSTLTTHAQENLTGARIVRAYRQEAAEIERFGRLNEEYLIRNMSLVRLYGTMHPLFSLLAGLGAAIVIGLGGALVIRGTISVGSFVAFGLYLGLLTWPLIALTCTSSMVPFAFRMSNEYTRRPCSRSNSLLSMVPAARVKAVARAWFMVIFASRASAA